MSYEISPSAVLAKLASEEVALSLLIENAYDFQEKIQAYLKESELQGEAYKSSKCYYQTIHLPMIRGIILYAEEKIVVNKNYRKLIQYYWSGEGHISEEELVEQRRKIILMKQDIEDNATLSSYDWILDGMEQIVNDKIKKIHSYIQESNRLYSYSNADSLLQNIKKGIQCMNHIEYKTDNKTFQLGAVDLSWATYITKFDQDKYENKAKEKYKEYLQQYPGQLDNVVELMKFEDAHPQETQKTDRFLSNLDEMDVIGLKKEMYTSPEPYRSILFSMADTGCQIKIISGKEAERLSTLTAFSSEENVILLKEEDMVSIRVNSYRSVFHEIGHAVNYHYTCSEQFTSNKKEIYNSMVHSIKKDITTYMSSLHNNTELTEDDQKVLQYIMQGEGNKLFFNSKQKTLYTKVSNHFGYIIEGKGAYDAWSGITQERIFENSNNSKSDNTDNVSYKECSEYYATHFANGVLEDKSELNHDITSFPEATKAFDQLTIKIAYQINK